MLSTRYTIVIEKGAGGAERVVSFGIRTALVTVAAAVALPLMLGWGARWASLYELAQLRSGYVALEQENQSFRAATGQLTEQISALQAVVLDLGERSKLDPAAAEAIAKLPPMVRNRAIGGGSALSSQATRTLLSAAVGSPESTFGILRDLLGVLESRLQLVRSDVERWEALGRATPTIWPALGWLSDGFGRRTDPFTGEMATHLGLDISGDKGQPIFATADGVVRWASWNGDFGNLVVLSHEFGLTTRYAHLSKVGVKAGQTVKRGDIVGYMGSTGRSSGPHLHYEVWAHDRPVNPLRLLTSRPRP
jgi:murein DD-endopeptidase MepM/ murein hydrolase activator NlpD